MIDVLLGALTVPGMTIGRDSTSCIEARSPFLFIFVDQGLDLCRKLRIFLVGAAIGTLG